VTLAAVPSQNPEDLLLNARAYDEFVNSTADTFTDRLGNVRKTLTKLIKIQSGEGLVIDDEESIVLPLDETFSTFSLTPTSEVGATREIANVEGTEGMVRNILFYNPAPGGYSLTFGSAFQTAGGAPVPASSTTSGVVDLFSMCYSDVLGVWIVSLVKGEA